MTYKKYDALVIGSGAAGSFAVKTLTENGLEVLLLEAGPDISIKDFSESPPQKIAGGIDVWPRFRAGFRGQHIQARFTGFKDQFRQFYVNDWLNPYTTPHDKLFLWVRGRQLGGRLHTWGRVVLRMSDYDFKAASRDGFGEDWPISYADLAPYYDRVEEFLGVYGTKENIPGLPNGKYLRSPKLNSIEQAFKAKVEGMWPERSVIPWRVLSPNLKRIPLPILAAKETGRLTIQTDAIVKKITVDAVTGRASGVICIDRNTREELGFSADMIVLCASTIESVRLLLNSACPKHPNGLGNSSGLLGRYFMDQCPSIIVGSVPYRTGWERDDSIPQDPFRALPVGVYIPRYQNLDSITHPNFARGFAFQGAIGELYVPEDHPAMFGLMGYGEMPPYYDNTISIDPRKKDAWRIPVPRIRLAFTPNEHQLMAAQLKACREMAELNGFDIDFAGNALGLDREEEVLPRASWLNRFIFRKVFKKSMAAGAAIHECGGARMGLDPKTSILNPYNQCWDIKNLLVTDGSCFVSSGAVGPALTIMALTIRACENIAKEYKHGIL